MPFDDAAPDHCYGDSCVLSPSFTPGKITLQQIETKKIVDQVKEFRLPWN